MIPRLFRVPYGCGIVRKMRAEFPRNVWKKYMKFYNNITTYCVEKRVVRPIDMI
jgi:hypothetical protein